jgi:hypothetical protein
VIVPVRLSLVLLAVTR